MGRTTKEQYRAHYREYQGTKEQKENRAARGRARYAMEKKHGKAALEGKDVGHKKPLSRGGSNAASNLSVQSVSANRGWKRKGKP